MRISRSEIFDRPNAFTAILVDGNLPETRWSHVRIDGSVYKPELALGSNTDLLLIKGKHDFAGKEIVFE